MVEHIVAIFGTENAAAAAESDLESAGVLKVRNQALQSQYARCFARHFCQHDC